MKRVEFVSLADGKRWEHTPSDSVANYQVWFRERDFQKLANITQVVGHPIAEGRVWLVDGGVVLVERMTDKRWLVARDTRQRRVYVRVPGGDVRSIERLIALGGHRARKPLRPWE